MDDFFDDGYERKEADAEVSDDEEPVLMAKLDIDQIVKQACGTDDANATQLLKEAEQSDIDDINYDWAVQFLGNHAMNQHEIDDKIKRGEVPLFVKRKKFVKKKISFFS